MPAEMTSGMKKETNTEAESSVLIYNANKGSNEELDKRDYRYERRNNARKISKHERLKKCGCTSIGIVTIGLKGNLAQQRGLYTCGSVWVCPVCNARVMTQRGKEIESALALWTERGGFFVFETLTLSHRPGDSVAKQRSCMNAAWRAINNGSFKSKHQKYGQQGYFRIAEVTSGENGEHLHLHVMRFIERWLPSDELQDWKDAIFNKWANAVEAQGMRRPSAKFHDFQQVEVAENISGYFTKNYDNPREASDALLTGGNANTSMWHVLDQAIANPQSDAARRWNAYEKDTLGMKQITWSRGLRATLGMGAEKSDEELAEEHERFEPIIEIKSTSVRRLGMLGRIHSRILRHIEKGDLDTALHLLDEHGIQYTLLLPIGIEHDSP